MADFFDKHFTEFRELKYLKLPRYFSVVEVLYPKHMTLEEIVILEAELTPEQAYLITKSKRIGFRLVGPTYGENKNDKLVEAMKLCPQAVLVSNELTPSYRNDKEWSY